MKTDQDATQTAGAGSLDPVVRRLSRIEIEKAIEAGPGDCAFTLPFFLAEMLVKELRKQKLNKVGYTGDDFSVVVKIKKGKTPNEKLSDPATKTHEYE